MSPLASDPGFVPILPNPYIVGYPIRDPEMFFGREAEFDLVYKRFKNAKQGSLLVFCGERRSGKTSILLQVQQGRLGSEFIPVLIDMQAMAVENEAEFLHTISREIAAQFTAEQANVRVPEYDHPKPSLLFREFVESVLLRDQRRKLLLLFDEYELFEDKFEDGVLSNDFLLILANLMESLSVFVIFTGSQHLKQRRQEYWRILDKAHEYRRISYLQPSDAMRLIHDPVSERVDYAEDTAQSIMRLTAGHPFYTQAVCQNVVDLLNETRANTLTASLLDAVIEPMIENPLPQMTFLWESLERDEKLVLALLAQTLKDPDDAVTAEQVVATLETGKYPLELSPPVIATALEALFEQELLLKSRTHSPCYAFKMDLWRRWIQRMHSVWQVMQEEGMAFRRKGGSTRRKAFVGLTGVALAILVWVLWPRFQPSPTTGEFGGNASNALAGIVGLVRVLPFPSDASVQLDGMTVAFGACDRSVQANRDHLFRVAAPGYVDSSFVANVDSGDTLVHTIALRPQTGSVRIEPDPLKAMVSLNGVSLGTGVVEWSGLEVPDEHTLQVQLEGYESMQVAIQVFPDSKVVVPVHLEPMTHDLNVISIPDGAEIRVDGEMQGQAPLTVSGLSFGRHTIHASRVGYESLDTLIVVNESTRNLRLQLPEVPAGVLIVRGDMPARIYIDQHQVGSGELLSSGEQPTPPGAHEIEVVFRDGSSDRMVAKISPGQRLEILWKDKKLQGSDPGR